MSSFYSLAAATGVATVISTIATCIIVPLVHPVIHRWISYAFEKRLETLRYKARVREQAAKVAEFLAQAWNLPADASPSEYRRVNQLSWELALYLREDTYRHLTDGLRQQNDRNPFSALLAARIDLLGEDAGALTQDDILFMWPNAGRAEAAPPARGD